jgi:hypothetical protein
MKAFSPILFAAALGLASAGTASASVMQYTATSTVAQGSDGLGLFGPASGSLAGKSIVLSIRFDTALNNFNNAVVSSGAAPASLRVSVDGVDYLSTVLPASGVQCTFANALNAYGADAPYNWGVDQFSAGTQGAAANGLQVDAHFDMQTRDPNFVTGATTLFDILGTSSLVSLSLSLDVTGANGTTHLNAQGNLGAFGVEQIADSSAAAVPEPASLTLLGIGVLGLAARGRARRA